MSNYIQYGVGFLQDNLPVLGAYRHINGEFKEYNTNSKKNNDKLFRLNKIKDDLEKKIKEGSLHTNNGINKFTAHEIAEMNAKLNNIQKKIEQILTKNKVLKQNALLNSGGAVVKELLPVPSPIVAATVKIAGKLNEYRNEQTPTSTPEEQAVELIRNGTHSAVTEFIAQETTDLLFSNCSVM